MKRFLLIGAAIVAAGFTALAAESVDFNLVADEPEELRLDLGIASSLQFYDPVAGSSMINLGVDATAGFEADLAPFLTLGAKLTLNAADFYDLGATTAYFSSVALMPYAVLNFSGSADPVPTQIVISRADMGDYTVVNYIDPEVRKREAWGLRIGTSMALSLSTGAFGFSPLTTTFLGLQYFAAQKAEYRVDGRRGSIDESMTLGLDLRNGSATAFMPTFRLFADFGLDGISLAMAGTFNSENSWFTFALGVPLGWRTGLWGK